MSRSWTLPSILVCVACGNHGSKPKGQEAGGGSGSSASTAWQFAQFVDAPHHQVAVVRSGENAALVDGSGKLSPPVHIGTSDEIVAKGNGELVMLASEDRAHGLDASGREIWSVARHGRGTSGTSSFADASEKGTAVYALATGKPLYESTSPSQRVLYHRPDGYVFADASTLWFVEEATGTERWRQPISGLGDAAINARPVSVFVMHPDRTFEELDYALGKVLAKGTCEGKPPGESEHQKPSECAGYPNVDLGKDDAHRPVKDPHGGGDYHGETKAKVTSVVARDPVGRVRWTTPAPVQIHEIKGPFPADEDAKQVAFISGRDDARLMLVFDDADGKLLLQHKLVDHERLLGFSGVCWLIVNGKHAACVDARTGANIWDVVTSGEMVDARPLSGGEALLADGSPLTLSRIAKDGHRRWQTEIPSSHLERGVDPDRPMPPWLDDKAWELSDTLGIVAAKDGLTVIDLASGKLAKVH